MGSVQRLLKGKYKLTISQGYDDNGKRIRRYKTVDAENKRHAERLLRDFERELEEETQLNGEGIRFGAFVEQWRRDYAEPHLDPATLELYEIFLKPILATFSNHQLDAINNMQLSRFLNNEKIEGRASLEKKYNVLKSVFKYAVKWHLLEHDPMEGVTKPKNPHNEMDFYDRDEMKQLMEEIKVLEIRQQLKIKIAAVGGLRRGEILAIADDAIIWETNKIKVFRSVQHSKKLGLRLKKTKTGDSRIVTFPSWLMKELRIHYLDVLRHHAANQELWRGCEDASGKSALLLFGDEFGRPVHPHSVTQFWGRFMKRTPQLRRIRFQDLRHSSASLILSEGVNIKILQKRLGHRRANTTLNVYAHVTERDDKKASDVFDDFV